MTVIDYINSLDEPRKTEITTIHEFIVKTCPTQKPEMISGMIMYGAYDYKSKSGCEGRWGLLGLCSRKNYISIYACAADGKQYLAEKYKEELKPANVGKGCIRYKKVADIDFTVLKKVFKEAEKLGGMSMMSA